MPILSVVISVHNGMPFLQEAVESILGQTFTNFECIIINNASTDGTAQYLHALQDPRVRVLHNEKLLGVSLSRNKGFDAALGRYIVVADADDISLPDRFARQVAFMENNPQVWACGGQMEVFGAEAGKAAYPTTHEELIPFMLFDSPIPHPACILRADALRQAGLRYDPSLIIVHDYELFARISLQAGGELANLPECVLRYRRHPVSLTKKTLLLREERERVIGGILALMGIPPEQQRMDIHMAAENPAEPVGPEYIQAVEDWFALLESACAKQGTPTEKTLRPLLARKWHALMGKALHRHYPGAFGMAVSTYFRALPLCDEKHLFRLAGAWFTEKLKRVFPAAGQA